MRMSRISQIAILCIFVFFVKCGCGRSNPPTDDEMIQHFYAHESAFNQIKEELASMRTDYSHYPPYYPYDTTCLAGMSISTQEALDSLLVEIGCERIFYSVEAGGQQEYEKEMPDVYLSIPYFASGYSIGGTSKDFVYSTTIGGSPFEIIEDRELNDIYREQKNTIVYKSIKGNWYIRLMHD